MVDWFIKVLRDYFFADGAALDHHSGNVERLEEVSLWLVVQQCRPGGDSRTILQIPNVEMDYKSIRVSGCAYRDIWGFGWLHKRIGLRLWLRSKATRISYPGRSPGREDCGSRGNL